MKGVALDLQSSTSAQAPSMTAKHNTINDVIGLVFSHYFSLWRTNKSNSKHPDKGDMGYHNNQHTCDCTIQATSQQQFRLAASQKVAKYTYLSQSFHFQPIALKTPGPVTSSALQFLYDLGQQLSAATGDVSKMAFLLQRLSVIIRYYNSVLIHISSGILDMSWISSHSSILWKISSGWCNELY